MTSGSKIEIRAARPDDALALVAVYGPYVLSSPATFEIETPSVEDFASRIETTSADYPYLLAEIEGRVVGYAYGCQHRARAAYRFSVETSVYIADNCRGRGIGRALYERLFEELADSSYQQAYAGVTLPNEASVALHHKLGFQTIGVFPKIGFKFDTWHDVGWYHRPVRLGG